VLSPVISILMPVFNCERTIRSAMQSILNQTFVDWELLVLDDGSTDDTESAAKRIRDPRMRWIADRAGNLGLAARLNQGIDLARGAFIARMDGDDISFPCRLERQFEFLEEHPAIDLVGCGMVVFKGEGEVVGQQPAREDHAKICGGLVRSCLLPHATWLGRTSWFRSHRYNISHRRAEDRELLLRSCRASRFAGLPQLLYGYRVNGVSVRKNARARYEYLRALLADARTQRNWIRSCAAGAVELMKLSLDTVALATSTDHWFLRHRAMPLRDTAVIAQWQHLWSELQTPVPGAF
jgi:glycosyltransferase involved in cell wall biosynthesis